MTGVFGHCAKQIQKLCHPYGSLEPAVFFQPWWYPNGKAPASLGTADDAVAARWDVEATLVRGYFFYPSHIVVFGAHEDHRSRKHIELLFVILNSPRGTHFGNLRQRRGLPGLAVSKTRPWEPTAFNSELVAP